MAKLTREQILTAQEIYSFGSEKDVIYIVRQREDENIHCCSKDKGEWWLRSSESFWWAWDMDPMLYPPLTGKEAAAIIEEWEG